MRSRWFHKPVFHTALSQVKRVTWLELFFDLVFVAAVIQLGDGLSDGITAGEGWGAVGSFALHFVPLVLAWMGFTFYSNRFDHDDIVQRLMVFGVMFAMGAMAITGPRTGHPGDIGPQFFSGAFAFAQALVAGMYWRVWRHTPEARTYAKYWGAVFAVSAIISAIAIVLPEGWCEAATVGSALVIFGAPISRASRQIQDLFPIDQEQLAERFGLLTIIVLGESLVNLLGNLNGMPAGKETAFLLEGAQNLAMVCALWWVYFDDVAHSKLKEGRGNWMIWFYAHVPLVFAITGLGAAFRNVLSFARSGPPAPDYPWLLSGMLATALISVAVIDSVTEREDATGSDRLRGWSRVAGAAVVLALAPAGATMHTFPLLLTAVCVALVVFDLLIAPLASSEESEFSLAQHKERLAEQRSSGGVTRKIDVRDAVRKGAPAELRQDFYYFFMEGTWTRLFTVFAGIFLLVNVFFAGLYLLDSAAISGGVGENSFADAFAFSIQTMSTIGYGAMSPASGYADLVVTIEAATSILLVAVGTGVVFAKLSRPSAAVVFSRNILATRFDGQPALVFRVGNARGNELVDAQVSVTIVREHVTVEGEHMRRLYDLKLLRSRSPIFALTWTVYHVIDEHSPVADVDWDDVDESGISAVIVSLMGHDSTYGDTAYSRHAYGADGFVTGHRFADVISFLEDGRLVVDYSKIHDIEPCAPGESVEVEAVDDAEEDDVDDLEGREDSAPA